MIFTHQTFSVGKTVPGDCITDRRQAEFTTGIFIIMLWCPALDFSLAMTFERDELRASFLFFGFAGLDFQIAVAIASWTT